MFSKSVQRIRLRFIAVTVVASVTFLLSACSVPVPLGDLLPQLGENKSGQFAIPNISKSGFDLAPFLGESKAKSLTGPTVGQTVIVLDGLDLDGLNPVIDLSGRDEIQSKLVSIGLSYKIALTKVGDYTTQNVMVQPYMAPADGSQLTDAANALGSPVALNFVAGSQTIEARVDLKASQIKAINERKLRLGFGLTGTIKDFNSLLAGLSYDIKSFKIVDLKVNVDERFPAGGNGDVLSIADIDTRGLIELYLAASSETNLYQPSNLIKSIDVDISGSTLTGSLSVQNPLVAAVLANDQVRYGIKIRGSSLGIEAVASNDTEVTFEYEVTKLTGTVGIGF